MFHARRFVIGVAGGIAVLAAAPAALAAGAARPQTLTVSVESTGTHRGTVDNGQQGLSIGDTYQSIGVLRSSAGKVLGAYHVSCTITDPNDHGSAWASCWTAALIKGRGTVIATGLAHLLHVATSPGGFGVAPPKASFAIVGGTGSYAGARGQMIETRTEAKRTLRFQFTL
ncbi:MAG TPA: hypothetical protein VGF81_02620 [Solirubrobacteraceae bacterium]|jgi:hypothetical protein